MLIRIEIIYDSNQNVHLSTDIDTSTVVKRRNEKPAILRINSKTAYDDGVLFLQRL
jgi:RNA:NAD 2'-phosphotransferase (TPT1/KptA family)